VVEHLPSKCETLSSNCSTTKKVNKRKKKIKQDCKVFPLQNIPVKKNMELGTGSSHCNPSYSGGRD
jgi:hypothetical protein